MSKSHIIGPIEGLGTTWYVELFVVEESKILEIANKLEMEIKQFESDYSRFKDSSLVGQLNNGGTIINPPKELRSLLRVASEAFEETNGIFNIAIGENLEKSGYDKTYSFQSVGVAVTPKHDVAKELLSKQEMNLPTGIKIDLGGFGKGFLIDKLAIILKEKFDQEFFLINGGGDIYATSEKGKPVAVGLQHPTKREELCGEITIMNEGFAASSPYVRAWTDQHGNQHNHLVGEEKKRAVFVTASSATQADIWATTLAISAKAKKPGTVILHNYNE